VRRAVLALVAALVLTGCGVGAQPDPEPVSIPRPSTPEAGVAGTADGPRVTVWFVRGSRLEAAERPVERPAVDTALAALVAGPTRSEVVDGLRTALSPQSLTPDRPVSTDDVVTIAVSREFTEVAGGNQLLATAQVVFTVTELPGVEAVRVTADGSPVEVPTDEGLSAEPVGREDYASVAAPDRSPTPSPTSPPPSGGEPSGGDPSTTPPAAPSTPGRRRRDVTGP
jgi:sporulation and spore germination protein